VGRVVQTLSAETIALLGLAMGPVLSRTHIAQTSQDYATLVTR
jgi:hypothetical protein